MSKLRLDISYTHDKNLGTEKVGEFCGSPIHELYTHAQDVDQFVETMRLINLSKQSPESTVPLEILPGEIVCDDNIVRRWSTAEANPEFYDYVVPAGCRKVSLAEAKQLLDEGAMVTFRPNRVVNAEEEFAIVHEEVN